VCAHVVLTAAEELLLLCEHSLPRHSPQVLPVQQVTHHVTRHSLGSISHIKAGVRRHVVGSTLRQLKDQRDNLAGSSDHSTRCQNS
jgi:hypothetical protein